MINGKKHGEKGDSWIWLNASAVAVCLILVAGLLGLIAVRGLGHFWPAPIIQLELSNGQLLLGEVTREELFAEPDGKTARRFLMKTGNRDVLGADFRWVNEKDIKQKTFPSQAVAIERDEWGNMYGFIGREGDKDSLEWSRLQEKLNQVSVLNREIETVSTQDIGSVNYQLENIRLQKRSLVLQDQKDPRLLADLAVEEERLERVYDQFNERLSVLHQEVTRDALTVTVLTDSGSVERELLLGKIVHLYRPNDFNWIDKVVFYSTSLWRFLTENPREANTEGGIFPAIFGTLMMVMLMSVLVTPLGIVSAVYLREYAKQGLMIRSIRIAVNNLAGVPSIVYGVFGLGFFVYGIGGNIDQLFYQEALPAPTFGTPGLLWASLTLALLTVPVVIVSTEEGLARIPRSIREGSLALGATKAETLWRTVLPMASPAIMTGLILAVARAAGEVAPLMLVGVVKLAPSLPLDGNFPFLHLERKFMHLGFHIYDVGFQSPNVEASRPLVYATALLLVLVVIALNLTAMMVRNRLRERYRAMEH